MTRQIYVSIYIFHVFWLYDFGHKQYAKISISTCQFDVNGSATNGFSLCFGAILKFMNMQCLNTHVYIRIIP